MRALTEIDLEEEGLDFGEIEEGYQVYSIAYIPQEKNNAKLISYPTDDPVFEDYVNRYLTACRKMRRYLKRFDKILKNGFNKKDRTEQMGILNKLDKGIEKIVHKAGFEDYKFQEIVRDFKETAIRMSRSLTKPAKTYLYH